MSNTFSIVQIRIQWYRTYKQYVSDKYPSSKRVKRAVMKSMAQAYAYHRGWIK